MTNLFINLYPESHEARRKELFDCLQNNINNSSIDIIYILVENVLRDDLFHNSKIILQPIAHRPTFQEIFELVNLVSKEKDINIVTNNDIYFDHTLNFIDCIKENDCYAITKIDIQKDKLVRIQKTFSQDTWIFRGRIRIPGFCNFTMGLPGCDNRLAYELDQFGYDLQNPSHTIHCIHLHESNVRRYDMTVKVPMPYKDVRQGKLNQKYFINSVNIIDYHGEGKIQENKMNVLWIRGDHPPVMSWYKESSNKYYSCFIDNYDEYSLLKEAGYLTTYIPAGFDERKYHLLYTKIECPKIIMIMDFHEGYKFSEYILKLVRELKTVFGKQFGLYGKGWGELADGDGKNDRELYCSCKIFIAINFNDLSGQINENMLRAMGSGAMVLSYNQKLIGRDFSDKINIVLFNTVRECLHFIDWFLNKDESRRKMVARAGMELVRAKHTNHKRVEMIENNFIPL